MTDVEDNPKGASRIDQLFAELQEDESSDQLVAMQEGAWIEVIRKMEEVYSDLIRYEVDLEDKNSALEDAQRFINSVLSSISDVLIVCDNACDVVQANEAFYLLTGYSEDQVVGQPVYDLLADKDIEALKTVIGYGSAVDLVDDPLKEIETRLRTQAGRETEPVAMHCALRRDHTGRVAGRVLTGRPVGELRAAYQALNKAHNDLKAAQQQVIQSEKMASLGRLVAGVAHELNNPISFIYGNVFSLNRYSEKISKYLDAIHGGCTEAEREALRAELRIDAALGDLSSLAEGTQEGAQRVSEIVKNLRRLSFGEGGKSEPFDLVSVIRPAVQWASRGRKKDYDIVLDMPDSLMVQGTEGQIHQVIVNLLQNALDAMEAQAERRLVVTLQSEGAEARISITDSGVGIAEDDLARIFDPFFTTKPVGQGTGLGLWISYDIVKHHGSELKAYNNPDGGVTFTFSLPAP